MQVTLGMEATEAGEHGLLLPSLNSLGDNVEPGGFGYFQDRLDQERRRRARVEVAYEGLIYFDDVRGEIRQVGERGIAGPEIIDRDLDAEAPKAVQSLAAHLPVIQTQSLGDLEDEKVGSQAGDLECVENLVDEIGLAELDG